MGIRNRVLIVMAGLVLRLALLSPYPHSTFTLRGCVRCHCERSEAISVPKIAASVA